MTAVLDTMAGLQAQYAPAMYVGLWSRMEGLRRAAVTEALQQRTVAQGTLMRVTIHLVSAGDYWPVALAIRDARRVLWLKLQRTVTADDLARAADRLEARLQAEGPISRKDMEALLTRELVIGVGLWVDLVRVPPSGTWERRRADLYDLARTWLGPPPAGLTVDAAQEHLVRRYLGGFGPATPNEIADWAGLPLQTVKAILGRLGGLRSFRSETTGKANLFDLPDAPLPDPATPAPVRFLPVWDASLLVHCRRGQLLREEHRPRVFNVKTPHSVNTFLVDGVVAGTWRYEKGRIDLAPFEPLPKSVAKQVDAEAERLAAFHADK
jgi:hypothetical protein